jgi:hypothetical protein
VKSFLNVEMGETQEQAGIIFRIPDFCAITQWGVINGKPD